MGRPHRQKRRRDVAYGLAKQVAAATDRDQHDKLLMTLTGTPHLSAANVLLDCFSFFKKDRPHQENYRRLGEERVDEALSQWVKIYCRKHKLTALDRQGPEAFEAAQNHPEIDREVFEWFKTEIQLQPERQALFQNVGCLVYEAYCQKDFVFFSDLTKAIKTLDAPPKQQVRKTILLSTQGGRLTAKELTDWLSVLCDPPPDESRVRRLCKELGARLKPGKPGYPKGRPRSR